jgi:cytoskeletal protein RodZ
MSEEKPTLGEYFRREREKKGIDLKEIEERTKISAQTLIFLEEDQLDMLPPRTFLRGFLRVISKEFHFDEDELLAHLEETLAGHEQKKTKLARGVAKANKAPFPLPIIIIAVIIIVAVIFLLTFKGCDQQQTEEKTSSLTTAYACSEAAVIKLPAS